MSRTTPVIGVTHSSEKNMIYSATKESQHSLPSEGGDTRTNNVKEEEASLTQTAPKAFPATIA